MNLPAQTLVDVASIDGIVEPMPWSFATERAADIAAHWADQVARQPHLFDGRVLMLTRGGVVATEAGSPVFAGAYTEVDFKAFLAWRDFGHPVRGFRNGFGMAALRAADGSFLLGEMGSHTANAGRIYFPSGTPDRGDIVGQRVDLAGSIRRELAEETGLDPATLAFAPGFTIIEDELRVCCMQLVQSAEPADVLVARIHATLASQALPELARMHVVRGSADLTAAMPPFVTAYLRRAFAAEGQPG